MFGTAHSSVLFVLDLWTCLQLNFLQSEEFPSRSILCCLYVFLFSPEPGSVQWCQWNLTKPVYSECQGKCYCADLHWLFVSWIENWEWQSEGAAGLEEMRVTCFFHFIVLNIAVHTVFRAMRGF